MRAFVVRLIRAVFAERTTTAAQTRKYKVKEEEKKSTMLLLFPLLYINQRLCQPTRRAKEGKSARKSERERKSLTGGMIYSFARLIISQESQNARPRSSSCAAPRAARQPKLKPLCRQRRATWTLPGLRHHRRVSNAFADSIRIQQATASMVYFIALINIESVEIGLPPNFALIPTQILFSFEAKTFFAADLASAANTLWLLGRHTVVVCKLANWHLLLNL